MRNLPRQETATAAVKEQICESVQHLIELLAATPVNFDSDRLMLPVHSVSTDTRSLSSGDVFIALRGDRFDGHAFVAAAIAQGAVAAIVDHPVAVDLPLLVVPDTLQAYQAIARRWRQRFAIPVIAVTGFGGQNHY
jgi:UDP-N-acetylmuramoyl-tripeptide--D-alanyl-D-alanine ligase